MGVTSPPEQGLRSGGHGKRKDKRWAWGKILKWGWGGVDQKCQVGQPGRLNGKRGGVEKDMPLKLRNREAAEAFAQNLFSSSWRIRLSMATSHDGYVGSPVLLDSTSWEIAVSLRV